MARGILGSSVAIGHRHKRVLLQNPGPDAADGLGGFTQSWIDLPPAADARIESASAAALERLAAGTTVLASASHVVTLPFREGVSTRTRLLLDGRVLHVAGVHDPEERHIDLVLICEERVA